MAPPDPRAAFFLERRAYRRRRIGDAARVLPVLGIILVLLPILWTGEAALSSTAIYIFAAWVVLIVIAAIVSRLIGPADLADADRPPRGPDDDF